MLKRGDSGKLEVWQYIDTIEEANRYFYIARVIEKYGVKEILPIAMNRVGGFHSLKWDIEKCEKNNYVDTFTV